MYYMHIDTGSVDTKGNWIRDIQACTLDAEGAEIRLTRREAEKLFNASADLIHVKKDKDGDWVENLDWLKA